MSEMREKLARLPFVMFACNHPETGLPAHRIDRLSVSGGTELLLQAEGEPLPYQFSTEPPTVYLGSEWYLLDSPMAQWAGNWCWDGASMRPGTLASLLNHLRRSGWTLDEALQSLWDRWESSEPITAADLEWALSTTGEAGRC